MCGQRGRAISHRRPSCLRRAAQVGSKVLRHGKSASGDLPTLMAELFIEAVTIWPGDTEPPVEPEAAV